MIKTDDYTHHINYVEWKYDNKFNRVWQKVRIQIILERRGYIKQFEY